jgi:hypothetical protein
VVEPFLTAPANVHVFVFGKTEPGVMTFVKSLRRRCLGTDARGVRKIESGSWRVTRYVTVGEMVNGDVRFTVAEASVAAHRECDVNRTPRVPLGLGADMAHSRMFELLELGILGLGPADIAVPLL